MPKFHLPLLSITNINNDYHIEIDGSTYDESKTYLQASTILFKNKYGCVTLKGFFNLAQINIPTIITIDNLSLEILQQFLNSCFFNFCKYKLQIEFYFPYDDIKYIKNIEENLFNEFDCNIDYEKRIISLNLNELRNINIKEMIGKFEEEKEETMNLSNNYEINRQKIKDIDNEEIDFGINNINVNKNDENIINQNINENNDMDNSSDNIDIGENNSKLGNIFTHLSEKTEEVKLETYSEMNQNIIKVKKPYIKISDINNNLEFNKDDQNYLSKIQNPKIKNILNKLISNGASLMNKNSKENILNQFNVNFNNYLFIFTIFN